MRTILSFVRPGDDAFDDATTRIMGEAFEAACALLGDITDLGRETVADRIFQESPH